MRITYFHRYPIDGAYSIERHFEDVRKALPPHIKYYKVMMKYPSKGIFPRLYNALTVIRNQNDVNHITGDVHYLAIFLKKRKTLLTICDCYLLERLHGIRKAIAFFFWYWLPEKRSVLISVISESAKIEILKYLKCSPDKIRVVHCSVSLIFKYVPRVFNSQKPIILQVGTTENKNLIRVSRALKGISCILHVVGSLSKEHIRSFEEDHIDYSNVWKLSNEEMVRQYQNCDLMIFASTYEGFGVPILEAQATGRPVVTSNLLSMPEVAGDAACLVDPFDVDDVRNGINRVIQDRDYREDLVRKGLKNVERFRPAKVAEQYVRLYEELVSGIS